MTNLHEVHDERFPSVTRGDYLTFLYTKDSARGFETQLYESKWWDYRFMSPIEATLAYIDAFGVEARKIYAREFDEEKARHVRVATGEDMLHRLEKDAPRAKERFASYWRGRACADAIGMPYSDYISSMMDFRMRLWKRRHIPLPNQLYGQREIEKTIERWTDVQQSRIRYAEHHAYMPENWCGAPAQVAYVDHLIERARERGDMADFILRDMVLNDRIPPQALRERLGEREYAMVVESRSH